MVALVVVSVVDDAEVTTLEVVVEVASVVEVAASDVEDASLVGEAVETSVVVDDAADEVVTVLAFVSM